MKQSSKKSVRRQHITACFNKLDDTNQEYIENLTAQLAKIHETAPESQLITGKKVADTKRSIEI